MYKLEYAFTNRTSGEIVVLLFDETLIIIKVAIFQILKIIS